MKSQSILISCNKRALSSFTMKYQRLGKNALLWSPVKVLRFAGLSDHTNSYRSMPLSRRLCTFGANPCFATEPTTEDNSLGQNILSSLNNAKNLSYVQKVQIGKTVLVPPVLTNAFIFGLYKLQKQSNKAQAPIRNICKYLVIYVVGSVCWLYYTNISTQINRPLYFPRWHLAQEMILKNLPLFNLNNSGGVFKKNQITVLHTENLKFFTNFAGIEEHTHSIESFLTRPVLEKGLQNKYLIPKKPSNFFLLNNFAQHLSQDTITQNSITINTVNTDLQSKRVRGLKSNENRFFFARKPLFLNKIKARKRFLSAQMLSQKKQYLCSGTAMSIGSAFDFLPRKIESTGFSKMHKSITNSAENSHRKFLVETTQIQKPKIYKFFSNIPLHSIKKAELEQNFGFGLTLQQKSLNTPKNTEKGGLKAKTAQQKGYLKVLFSSCLSTEKESELKPLETVKHLTDPKSLQFSGYTEVTKGEISNSKKKPGSEQKNFSRTLIMVPKAFRIGNVKPKKNLRSIDLIEKFTRSRLQSGFNFPEINFLNKTLIGVDKTIRPLKIKRNFYLTPEKSSNCCGRQNNPFVRSFRLTDPIPLSDKSEFSSNNKKIHLEYFSEYPFKRQEGLRFLPLGLKYQPSRSSLVSLNSYSDLKISNQFIENINFKLFFGTSLRQVETYNPMDKKNPVATVVNQRPQGQMHQPKTQICSKTVNNNKSAMVYAYGKGLKNFTNSPESFFGTSYLSLGERFTIEKIQSKSQIGFLYSVHNGEQFAPEIKSTLPFVSTGTSLNTVFGKKALKQQSSKRAFKTQSPFTNARAVSQWNVRTNTKFVKTTRKKTNIEKYLLYFKRISGKVSAAQKHLINPFKFYNPGTKRDRNIEDAMLTLEGYKKSRLFPTTHINYQGITSQLLPVDLKNESHRGSQPQFLQSKNKSSPPSTLKMPAPVEAEFDDTLLFWGQKEAESRTLKEKLFNPQKHSVQYFNAHRNVDIDLQSILSGMRQKNEGQRIAEKTIGPLYENSGSKKQSNHKDDYGMQNNSVELIMQHQESHINKKNFRNTNYYPFRTLLTFSQLKAQNNLKNAITEYNYPNSSNPIATTLDSEFYKNVHLRNAPFHSLGLHTSPYPRHKIQKPQNQKNQFSLQGSNLTKGFYFEKVFSKSILRSPSQSFKFRSSEHTINPYGTLENNSQRKSEAYSNISFWSVLKNLKYAHTKSALKNVFERIEIWSSFSKILFFSVIWSTYKILAIPLTVSNFLPATFTEAIGLQSFQKKYRIITRGNTKVDFKNLAGIEKTLSELRDLIWTFRLVGTGGPYGEYSNLTRLPYLGHNFGQQRSSVFSKTRNRFLLVGPPGTGKTLLVKALAAEANVPVIVQPVSQLRMISGVENPVSALFHVARQIKPCIIFLDELDTLGTDTNYSTKSANTEQKIDTKLAQKYTYTLLLELDSLISSTRDLLIIGATNRPETLNPALTRAGRFETVIHCNLPSKEQRFALFSLYLPQRQINISRSITQVHSKTSTQLSGHISGFKNQTSLGSGENLGVKKMWYSIPFGSQKWKKDLLKGWPSAPVHSKVQEQNSTTSLSTCAENAPGVTQQWTFQEKYHKVTGNVSYLSYLAKTSYGLSQASIETAINQSALNSLLQGKPCHTYNTLEQAFNSVRALTEKTRIDKVFSSSGYLSSGSYGKSFPSKLIDSAQNISFSAPTGVNESKVRQKTLQFLVCAAYKTTGPLLLVKRTSFYPQKGRLMHQIGALKKKIQSTGQNKRDNCALDSLQLDLFQNYAGQACYSLYNSTRCQSVQFSHTLGLYKNPVQLGTTLFLLKNEYDDFGKHLHTNDRFSNALLPMHIKVTTENNLLLQPNKNQKGHSWYQNIKKENNSKSTQDFSCSTLGPQILLQNTNSFFVKELSRQIRHSNPLKTRAFRLYLSRPIFRYDSESSIENKEYYPKNNYSKAPPNLFKESIGLISSGLCTFGARGLRLTRFPTVATLSHQTNTSLPNISSKALTQVEERFGKIYRENNFIPHKFSLYLAIVAFIFHNTLHFMQKNKELADYCVYKQLRYGSLYEFYIDQAYQKFV